MALMNDRQDLAGRDKTALFLNGPRCGLSIKPTARWLAPEHCPRPNENLLNPLTLGSMSGDGTEDDARREAARRTRRHSGPGQPKQLLAQLSWSALAFAAGSRAESGILGDDR